jgi:hypothetical protein
MRSVIALTGALVLGTAAGASSLAMMVESAESTCRPCNGTGFCNLACYVAIDRAYVITLAVLVGLAVAGIALLVVRSATRRRRKRATS